jgi:hypothetical protein
VRQFQAALTLAQGRSPDDDRLAISLMHLATVYDAQGQYTDAVSLYQRALVLHEQFLGSDHLPVADVLEAHAALQRKMHPVQSLLPWSPASKMAARARRIREREERALLQAFSWGAFDAHQIFGGGGE